MYERWYYYTLAEASELYCQLGILSSDEKDIQKQKKNVKDWQKEKRVESSGRTLAKTGTLEPEWNDEIELWVNVCVCAFCHG